VNIYKITLQSGVERTVTRTETPDKNIIGLWIWAMKQERDVALDFNECVIRSSEVAIIDRAYTAEDIVSEMELD
jgi:hypothetical protein